MEFIFGLFHASVLTAVGVVVGDYQPSTLEQPRELELCNFIAANCPFLRHNLAEPRQTFDQLIQVDMNLLLVRFTGISELEQQFSMVAMLAISWQLPDCARWSANSLSKFNISTEAKQVTDCFYSMKTQIWHPLFLFVNTVDGPMQIIEQYA